MESVEIPGHVSHSAAVGKAENIDLAHKRMISCPEVNGILGLNAPEHRCEDAEAIPPTWTPQGGLSSSGPEYANPIESSSGLITRNYLELHQESQQRSVLFYKSGCSEGPLDAGLY